MAGARPGAQPVRRVTRVDTTCARPPPQRVHSACHALVRITADNLHLRGNMLFIDGVDCRDDRGNLAFTQTPPPDPELKTLAEPIHRRVAKLMKRRFPVSPFPP